MVSCSFAVLYDALFFVCLREGETEIEIVTVTEREGESETVRETRVKTTIFLMIGLTRRFDRKR